jgi:molybdopterin converting factor small subunit
VREDGNAVTFLIPGMLRDHAGGQGTVYVPSSATTVKEALAALWVAYPGLRDRVVNERGELRQHVNVFVNEDNIRDCGGFGAPVTADSAITIVPAVSGG